MFLGSFSLLSCFYSCKLASLIFFFGFVGVCLIVFIVALLVFVSSSFSLHTRVSLCFGFFVFVFTVLVKGIAKLRSRLITSVISNGDYTVD